MHCTPVMKEEHMHYQTVHRFSCNNIKETRSLASILIVPALGVLTALLCARESVSAREPEEVDGPGLLSMATSDTTLTKAFFTNLKM